MLTKDKVIAFLQGQLRINDVTTKLKTGRLQFLNELMRQFHAYLPYHNLKLLATPPGERRLLTKEEIIEDCMENCLGGTCYVLNTFLNLVLRALEFDVSIAGCTMAYLPNIPNHHLVNLVKGVENPKDLYLLDPAGWYPTFNAVALHNLSKDENIYKSGFLQYKFEKENSLICRFHLKNKINEFDIEKDKNWRLYYYLSLPSADDSVVAKAISDTYTNRTSGLFKALIFSMYPVGKGVTLSKTDVRLFDEKTGGVESIKCETDQDIFNALSPYWPQVTVELIKSAKQNILCTINE